MKKVYIISLSILVFILSCNKGDDSILDSDRAKALIGQWQYAAIDTDRAIDINGDGIVNIDLYNTQEIRQCLKDNLTFFTERGEGEKGSYSVNDNGLSCTEEGPFVNLEQDRYELVGNSIIRFEVRNEMRILDMTQKKLTIETDDNLGDTDVIVTIVFVRK